jgi:aryl-alcohol dehydrogenase-like predicted oxidoreductase
MRHRVLHGDGATTSELVLGTWGLGGLGYGAVEAGVFEAVFERAAEQGFTLVDTAEHYDQALASLRPLLGRFPQVGLMVRVGVRAVEGRLVRSLDRARIAESLTSVVARTGRARIDVALLHTPTVDELREGGAVEALRDGIRAGLVRTWGASVTGVPEAHAAIDAGALVLALPFHAFHQPIFRAIASRARGRGVRVVAHSVLAYGLLAGRWAPDHRFAEDDHRAERWAPAELLARVEQLEILKRLVRGEVHGLRSAALRYVLDREGITAAIVGPRSVAQLDELVRDIAHIEGAALPIEDVVAFEALARARGLLD